MSPGIGRMTEAPFPVGPGGLRFLNRFAAPGLVRPPNPNHDLSDGAHPPKRSTSS